jgi:hypothetical protein
MSAVSTKIAPATGWRTRRAVASLSAGSLAGLVLLSRVVVWAAGVAGANWGHRVSGWRTVDPTGLTQSYGHLGNLLLGPVLRWDGLGYLSIARHGYSTATSIFFPVYPMTTAGLGWVLRSDLIAAVLISAIGFLVAMWLLHRLTELELGRPAADAAVLLLAFAPVSFFFTAMYTESLFLALSVGALYAARRERWGLAGILAALASATRVTGILLVVPMGLWLYGRRRRLRPQMLWLLLAPLALGGFLLYMHLEGFGWLAPFHNQHAHRFDGPMVTLVDAVRAAGHGLSATFAGQRPVAPTLGGALSPGFDSLVLLLVFLLAVAALVLTFRRLPVSYGVFALLALLVSVASRTKVQPLEGIDRYVLTIFPLWMAAGAWVTERRVLRPLLVLGALLLGFYSFEFATWAFVA